MMEAKAIMLKEMKDLHLVDLGLQKFGIQVVNNSSKKLYFSKISRGTERMGQIFDWDGTITGIPKAMIVRDQPFYVSSLCESRPNWGNMSICPHQYVSAEGTGSGYQKTSIII